MVVPSTVVRLVKVTGVVPATISPSEMEKSGVMTESYTLFMSSLPSVQAPSARSDTTLNKEMNRFMVFV